LLWWWYCDLDVVSVTFRLTFVCICVNYAGRFECVCMCKLYGLFWMREWLKIFEESVCMCKLHGLFWMREWLKMFEESVCMCKLHGLFWMWEWLKMFEDSISIVSRQFLFAIVHAWVIDWLHVCVVNCLCLFLCVFSVNFCMCLNFFCVSCLS
jgi:hypothetical protein